jgi:cyclohexyl-isocyanide hydratase
MGPTRARWLYHLAEERDLGEAWSPPSLGEEGFVHCSFAEQVRESARLHFHPSAKLFVHRVDPRRVGARIRLAPTSRGPMPHVEGPLVRDAVLDAVPLEDFAGPDRLTGTRFGFVGFRGMTLLDLVGVYDPISRIASMGFDATSTFELVAAQAGSAWEAHGARLETKRVRPPLSDFDVLVIPGGHGARELAKDAKVVAWLRSFPTNRWAISVCTGALLLGTLGRLAGKRATTHASALAELEAFGAEPMRLRVVDEGDVTTGAGVTSGIDVGLHVVRELCGDEARARVAEQMEIC